MHILNQQDLNQQDLNQQDLNQQDLKTIGEVEPDTLIHGDCLEVMRSIRSGSIDMILTDLPYG